MKKLRQEIEGVCPHPRSLGSSLVYQSLLLGFVKNCDLDLLTRPIIEFEIQEACKCQEIN